MPSAWVHSRYERQLADAALGGRPVRIDLSVRRLYCENPACPKRTFAEQVFERHPGAVLGSAVLGRLLDRTRDSAGLQAFLMLGEPGLEPLRQFDRYGLILFALSHGWAMNPADRSSWKGDPALVGSQPRSRASRMLVATWAGRMGTASAPTQLLGWAWPLVTIKVAPGCLSLAASTA
jgi:hypothetical protein